MRILVIIAGILAFTFCSMAADSAKPKLKVNADGFPGGHETPEAVACDLARAFIDRDAALFTNTCIRLYGSGQARTNYAAFLKSTAEGIRAEAARTNSPARGPKSIAKLFAARHLTSSGPASYGYAAFGFQDIMFVDVEVLLHGGKRALNRTLVIKDKDAKWYVHPAPHVSPLLSNGLNDESASEKNFTEAYDVVRALIKPAQPEPSFEGRGLSQWLDQYGRAIPGPEWEGNKQMLFRAENAVRSVGTNALPWLLQELSAREPTSGDTLPTNFYSGPAIKRRSQAATAFAILASLFVVSRPSR